MRKLFVLSLLFSFCLPSCSATRDGDGRYLGSGAWSFMAATGGVCDSTTVIANVASGWVYDVSPADNTGSSPLVFYALARQVETCGVRVLSIAIIANASESELAIWDANLFPKTNRVPGDKLDDINYPSIPAFVIHNVSYGWYEFTRPLWLDDGLVVSVTGAKVIVHYLRDDWR